MTILLDLRYSFLSVLKSGFEAFILPDTNLFGIDLDLEAAMGCSLSKCCDKLFGAKTREFDPEHHIFIEARDNNRISDADFGEMSFRDRTGIENQATTTWP